MNIPRWGAPCSFLTGPFPEVDLVNDYGIRRDHVWATGPAGASTTVRRDHDQLPGPAALSTPRLDALIRKGYGSARTRDTLL